MNRRLPEYSRPDLELSTSRSAHPTAAPSPEQEPPRSSGPRPIVVTNRRRPGWYRVLGRVAAAGLLFLLIAGPMAAGTVYTALAHDLPRLDRFDAMVAVGVTRFEAADGSLVGERYQERRIAVRWEDVPRPLALSFLAAEDARFFEHAGLDFRGIVRAMVTNLTSGGVKEGASTITQQLAKHLVGSQRAWSRKVKEAILARRMEDLYSKEQILTWYMNTIYFGHGSYGVKAAAQNYFRKELHELSLAEMAILAACAQSPSRVNPALDLPGARRRMNHILDNMVELGWVTAKEADEAKAWKFVVHPLRDTWGSQVPEYAEAVRKDAERFGIGEVSWLERGLTLTMAVDPAAQRLAHAALDEALVSVQKRQGYPGPLAKIPAEGREAFFQRTSTYLDPVRVPTPVDNAPPVRVGARLLGRVSAVTKETAQVELAADLVGTINLAETRWAAPWTVQPTRGDGRRDNTARVSFDDKLGSLEEALSVGDVVMVRVAEPKKAAAKPKPKPKPKATKKKSADTEKRTGFDVLLEPVPMMEGALVSTPLGLGGIDALATGWDYDRSEVDRTVARRQAGSTMKAIAFARAYDLGLPPSEWISGAPFVDQTDDRRLDKTRDDMVAWKALTESENPHAKRIFRWVLRKGEVATWTEWGTRLGLPIPLEGHLSEVLGAEQSARGLLSAFAIFAREGRRPKLELLRKVVARDGTVLERNFRPADPSASAMDSLVALWTEATTPVEPAISPVTSFLIARNLVAAVDGGTGKRARALNREAGGKTGTLAYDVWFAGFTGERAAVSWLGADRRERTLGPSERDNKLYGSTVALPLWVDFMAALDPVKRGEPRPGVAVVQPVGVEVVHIDPATGLLARPRADGTYDETALALPHAVGTAPTEMVPEPIEELPLEKAETEF